MPPPPMDIWGNARQIKVAYDFNQLIYTVCAPARPADLYPFPARPGRPVYFLPGSAPPHERKPSPSIPGI